MHYLFILALGYGIYAMSPRLANMLAWLMSIGIVLPIVAAATGTLTWAALLVAIGSRFFTVAAWLGCIVGIGLPIGAALAWWSLRDEN